MPKIALFFLFCAISGYGINGLPDKQNVNAQSENDQAVIQAVAVTNLDDTNSNGKDTSTELPVSSLSTKESDAVEPHKDPVTPNITNVEKNNSATTKPEIITNASIKNPMNGSKTADDNLDIPVTTIGAPVTTISPATTKSPDMAESVTLANDKPITVTILPLPTTPDPVVPVPAPKPGKWVLNGTNQTCIIVNMAVQFNVSYINEANMTVSKLFNLPDNVNQTRVTGDCGKMEQYIRLSFNDTKHVTNNFTLHFVKNESTKQYSLHHLEVALLNPNQTVLLVHNTSLVSGTGLSSSYRCLKQQNFTLTKNGTDNVTGYFLISDLQFQAFKTDNNNNFGEVKDCKLDTPDIVPIAVGCALAGLVVIVLIAYLMGRRRSQGGGGYSSM